jgi:transcriptional regulator with XRE-family HTH domain
MSAESSSSDAVSEDLADRLRLLRFRRRASLEAVAEAIGTTAQHLSALETRKIENPGYKIVLSLADYYGVSIGDLVGQRYRRAKLTFDEAVDLLRGSQRWRDTVVALAILALSDGMSAPAGATSLSEDAR